MAMGVTGVNDAQNQANSLTGANELDSGAKSTVRYPHDLNISSETDYMQFDFYTYNPPFNRTGSGLNKEQANNAAMNLGIATTVAGPAGTVIQAGVSLTNIGKGYGYDQVKDDLGDGPNEIAGNFGKPATGRSGAKIPSIQLFMPQDVSTSYATNWGGKEFGNAATGILNVVGGKDLINSMIEGVKSIPAGVNALGADVLSNLLSNANQSITQDDILGGTSAKVKNPNVELLFGGPRIRNVGFKFKMSARTEDEAKDIHNICHIFKMESLPAYGNAAGDGNTPADMTGFGNFIKVPDLVRMKLMKGGKLHPYLSQYKALALTNVDINYTPDGSYATYIGGYPTAVELSIQMVETKIVYKENLMQDQEWSY
jgi:hypothetical protein